MKDQPKTRAGRSLPVLEGAGVAGLVALTVLFLALSWRAWPDPLIDFGRELYTPWRLSQGAVLYRDVDGFYGPLSQYFNALLFHLAGRGFMVLVTANLIVFAGIVTGIYLLFRTAWGVGAALVSTATFISVFAFAQYVRVGNFNCAMPYAHETTHGMVLCVWLVLVLRKWLERPRSLWALLAGLMLGLTAVMKAEILLASGLVTACAGVIAWTHGRWPGGKSVVLWLLGAALPTLAFTVYFCAFFSPGAALAAACRGWLNVVTTTRYSGYSLQLWFLGIDHPGQNFLREMAATAGAAALIAAIAGAAWLTERLAAPWLRWFIIASLGFVMTSLACCTIDWLDAGRCLTGLVLIYVATCAMRLRGRDDSPVQSTRLMIGVLALAFLLRMILNSRIYDYGYYQAALAGILVPAVLVGELREWLGAGRWGTRTIILGSLALLLPGTAWLADDSYRMLRAKTEAVGEGRDLFYTFPPQVDATGAVLNQVVGIMRHVPAGQTLLVLPDGATINYLAQMPSPVAPWCFYAMATANGREDQIVHDLEAKPPDWVILMSRPLAEYGIKHYGTERDNGLQLMQWVEAHYEIEQTVGGDPLDDSERGAFIMHRKRELKNQPSGH